VDSSTVGFEVIHQEIVYLGELAAPGYRLPARWLELHAAVLARFGEFGVRPEHVLIESTSQHPKDFVTACFLPESILRFRLTNVEYWCQGKVPPNEALVLHWLSLAAQVLESLDVDPTMTKREASFRYHGTLEEMTISAKLGGLVPAPPAGLDPAGVTLRRESPRGAIGILDLQPSYLRPAADNAFVSVHVRMPGTLTLEESYAEASLMRDEALASLGLAPRWSRGTE
jgi:hypothetical protein